ncbi:MAG: serine O-acetyltransferase, partial [Chloroflexia bacterium]|nr:serine O-acetyltransferase [Chloroflexia bacterium]
IGVPARIVATRDPATGETRRVESLPDPEGEMLRGLRTKILELEMRLADLEEATHVYHLDHHLTYDALPESLWCILEEEEYRNGIADGEYNQGGGI